MAVNVTKVCFQKLYHFYTHKNEASLLFSQGTGDLDVNLRMNVHQTRIVGKGLVLTWEGLLYPENNVFVQQVFMG
jgi:hypothetical protein